ncbi:rhodanese-like domain-containing protein [Solirubrobacter ginsenosidimutans]|uniref:Rhodanese-like domain-containing protein n=1 Tax=Solirubrobacter ginsenosidimutans TaxID=490573 RepID=A0A9X3MR94_9ACTN|nr:rhodanese-like domain-containing protein [Solirubrobacter ginsenosidimutans]MDA0159768.1 rhodanese-like domain-containing protein [Solirubrobacter ginsenosidimutans]
MNETFEHGPWPPRPVEVRLEIVYDDELDVDDPAFRYALRDRTPTSIRRPGPAGAAGRCSLARVIAPVIDVADLRPGFVLADVRSYLDGRRGRDAYDAGHLPGAVFVSLDEQLADHLDPNLGGRHPLPSPAAFAAAMASLGIGDDDVVVAYDDAGGTMAARLVWMLRVTGHEAALLDGGIQAWDGALETDAPSRAPATFTARQWPAERLASIDEAADTGANVVIDARQRERFEGGADDLDPRFGHIPGAHSVPCRENLTADGRFLPAEELRAKFGEAGITGNEPVISYCGSGVTACHNLLALEHAGLGLGRLFPGSWSLWSRDPDRPLET